MSQYAALLDTLSEARRYVRSNPGEALRLVAKAVPEIKRKLPLRLVVRLNQNLAAGVRFRLVAPDVLRGYIDGAILEIQDHASREKK